MSLTEEYVDTPATVADFADLIDHPANTTPFIAAVETPAVLNLSRSAGGYLNTEMQDWPVTFDALSEAVSMALVGDKDGPYYLRGPCSSPRGDGSMSEGALLLIIDGDKSHDPETGEIVAKCVPPEDAHEALRELGYPHVLHTSYSHDPANGINKWRAVLKCHMKNHAELHAMSNWIIAQLNARGVPIVWVKEMGTMSQPWFFPRLRSDDAPFKVFTYELEDGEEHPLNRAFVERVTKEWAAKGSDISATTERGSDRDENTPIGRFLKLNDNADFIIGLLEEHAGCELTGTDLVNRKLAYRLLPPGSESGAAGVHVYRGKGDGTWLLFSHNASLELPSGKTKALDAFGVFQWLVHDGDQRAALADARRLVGEATGEPDYDAAETLINEALEIEVDRDRDTALKDIAKKINASCLIDESDRGKLIKTIARHLKVKLDDLKKDLKKARQEVATQPGSSKQDDYLRDDDGLIIGNAFNNSFAIRQVSAIGAEIRYDEFKERIVIRKSGQDEWSNFQDHMYHDLQCCLDHIGFERNNASLVKGAVKAVARENRFDSHRDWVESLKWDGKARVESFCHLYFGCLNDTYAKEVGRYIWSALAARAVLKNPAGEKADMVTILSGGQGLLKSTLLSRMAPNESMFGELDLSDSHAELVRKQRGRVIWELGELNGLSKRDRDSLKFLFSMKSDTHRENYAEFAEDHARRGLYFGTTNEEQFLNDDPSGHRRYLPLVIGLAGKLAILDENTRDQLWAEGLSIFNKSGIAFARAEELAKSRHHAHIDYDPWREALEEWLEQDVDRSWDEEKKLAPLVKLRRDLPCLTTNYLARRVLCLGIDKVDKRVQNRIGNAMRSLGYELSRGVKVSKYEKGNAWRRPLA